MHRKVYPEEPGAAAKNSVADCETLPQMGRPLDLVGQRNGVVGEADPALAVRICEKLLSPEPELARALALDEQGAIIKMAVSR